MRYALLLMGHVDDPACGEDGGASPEAFFAFDKEITDAGVVVSSFALEDSAVHVGTGADGERIVSSGPFAEVRFCPTGGIDAAAAPAYLALPNVACVGGSWMLPTDALKAGDWARIGQLAREAAALGR